MQPSLEHLKKVLQIEKSFDFTDKAIYGGLAKMVDHWLPEAVNQQVPQQPLGMIRDFLLRYQEFSPEGRAHGVNLILQWMDKGGQEELRLQIPVQQQFGTSVMPPSAQSAGLVPEIKTDRPVPIQKPSEPSARPVTYNQPGKADSQPGGNTSKVPGALRSPLTVLNGVGPRNSENLGRLGLKTLEDLLYYFPRRYDDYSQLKPIHKLWFGDQVTVVGVVQSVSSRKAHSGKINIVEVVINDGSGALRLTWFNQPWLENRFRVKETVSASGKVDQYLGRLVMNNPEWEMVDMESLATNRILPVYPLTAHVTQKKLRDIIKEVTRFWAPRLVDHMPEKILNSAGLINLGEALIQVHNPDDQKKLNAARQRLAFDEIFFLQMGVTRQKRNWQEAKGRIFEVEDDWIEAQISALPYTLTSAQMKAIQDIRSDLKSGSPMNRLLQGDVGSGKTIVAAMAAKIIIKEGAQAAIMAPTSILAEQHYRNFMELCTTKGPEGSRLEPNQVRLLISDTPEVEKQDIKNGLASGSIMVVIGTHALLEDPVLFKELQLVVIDEQHRFGVEQRSLLRSKGTNPHLLVMTATPIPRSLALTIYGDLDITVMDEMPAGRQEISTHVLFPKERERAYSLIRSQVEIKHQAFIVYPLVEENDKGDALAATQEFERLQKEVFPKLRLGLIHGRLKPDEKDQVMRLFREGDHDILVSTTVVEVGVDIPNASIMLIEGANRFGLAQLHQLRGRVGRGEAKSYCLLIPDHEDAAENERLAAMCETNDGFILAEKDLQQRGPGDFLGTRQAGYANLRMASLTDVHLIEKARTLAEELMKTDADLKDQENQLLAEALERFWGGGKGDVS